MSGMSWQQKRHIHYTSSLAPSGHMLHHCHLPADPVKLTIFLWGPQPLHYTFLKVCELAALRAQALARSPTLCASLNHTLAPSLWPVFSWHVPASLMELPGPLRHSWWFWSISMLTTPRQLVGEQTNVNNVSTRADVLDVGGYWWRWFSPTPKIKMRVTFRKMWFGMLCHSFTITLFHLRHLKV